MRTIMAIIVLALLTPTISLACSFDTDCDVGSKCIKKSGQIYGFCAGGMNPGNDNDRVPVRDSLDLNKSAGNTCNFDVDCGPGSKCLKEDGYITGVCVKGR
jgi:hypothetical protein